MSKMILPGVLSALLALALTPEAVAHSGHDHEEKSPAKQETAHGAAEHEHHGDPGAAHHHGTEYASLPDAWRALRGQRDSIAASIEARKLEAIHPLAEALPATATSVAVASDGLDASRLARVQSAARQIARIAGRLHSAADAGDEKQTAAELALLDQLLQLIEAQHPTNALSDPTAPPEDHDRSHSQHEH